MKPTDKNVVENLRRECPELAKFSDEQIIQAHGKWIMSDDYDDASQIVHWIDMEQA